MGRHLLSIPEPIAATAAIVPDNRFVTLMGDAQWNALHPAVRGRFGRKLVGAASLVYKGVVTESRLSRFGWVLAQLCRVIGAPLPLDRKCAGAPAIVTVTEDASADGQFWTRCYGRPQGFPQVIHSSKRFAGPTGLEEYVGGGVCMALRVTAEDGAMVFTSAGYSVRLGPFRVRLPAWLEPGRTEVRHTDLGDGAFAFDLNVHNPMFGELVHQSAVFGEADVSDG